MGKVQSKGTSEAGRDATGRANSNLAYEEFQPEFNWISDPSGSKTLKIYLPGFSKDQIKVQHDKLRGMIMIDGKRPAVANLHFRNEFEIPEHLSDQIRAVLEEGFLLVTFSAATKTPPGDPCTPEIMVLEGRATSQEGVSHVTSQTTMTQTSPSSQQSSPAPLQKPETQPETDAGKVTSDREEKGSPAAAVTLAPVTAEMVMQSRATYQEGVLHVAIQMSQTIPSSQQPSPPTSQKPETSPTLKDDTEKKTRVFESGQQTKQTPKTSSLETDAATGAVAKKTNQMEVTNVVYCLVGMGFAASVAYKLGLASRT